MIILKTLKHCLPLVYGTMIALFISGCGPSLIGQSNDLENAAKNAEAFFKSSDQLYVSVNIACYEYSLEKIVPEIAKKYGYSFVAKEEFNGGIRAHWKLIFQKQNPTSVNQSAPQKETPIIKELNSFIANKSAEIDKLQSMKIEAAELSTNNPNLISSISPLITEIDSKIGLLSALKIKAELFKSDVSDYQKVEEIKQWLNQN